MACAFLRVDTLLFKRLCALLFTHPDSRFGIIA
jgi:hypothetical protein